jgi:phosphate transport system substrate-binding protein
MNNSSRDTLGFVDHYDLSDLPVYTPARVEDTDHCHNDVCQGEWGVIRIQAGENFMSLITAWQNAFMAMHSSIRFANYFNQGGFGGLTTKKFDIATLGHAVWRTDVAAFRNVFGRNPHEIRLTGPFDQPGGIQPAPVFIVNKENPLAGLTLEQIDGIFGAERTGGWTNFYEWTTEAARSDAEDIRTWGQLGLGGEWADAPIRPYGFDATLSGWSHLIERVAFKGGGKWNPAVVEKVRGGLKKVADDEMVEAVLDDKFAIGFNLPKVVKRYPDLKVLPIAPSAGMPFVAASRQTLFDRTYPLSNNVYIYVDKPPEGLSDRLKEFLRFVLSRQGQQILAEQDRLTPLNAEDSRRQIAALD